MKLRNKIAAITAASMLAFAGVGFAAWTFTKTVNDSASIQGKVTAAIEAFGLAVQDGAGNDVTGLYIICDAPAGQTGLVAGQGIYWSTQADGSDTITSLTLVGSVTEDDNDIADINTYTGHFASTAFSAVNGAYVGIAAAAALDTTVVSASASADVQYVWTLPALSYNTIPSSVAQVNLLQAEVAALSLTFSFTFNVQSIA